MSDRAGIVRMFDHILLGYDIPKPESLLKISSASASVKLDLLPYSLATNLAHTLLWQNFWLQKLAGGRQRSGPQEWSNDFKVPEISEWSHLRDSFLEGLWKARAIAESEPFLHGCENDAEAVDALLCIAVHGAYHIGQMNLLKRAMNAQKRHEKLLSP
jgi:uncharacterized damage-inducible protein DinB